MRMLSLALVATLALTATAAQAADKPDEPKEGPTRLICKTEEILGTRLRKGRRCITAAERAVTRRLEWAYIEHGQRRAIQGNQF